MSERGIIDAVRTLRKMQENYHGNGQKLYMCYVDKDKAFDRVPRKVSEWAIRNTRSLD